MAATEFRVGLASVVPEERRRILLDRLVMVEKMRMVDGNGCLPLGELKANLGPDWIRLLVHLAERHRFNFRRIAKVQGAEWHIDGVARHVAERAGAEILPAAPVKWIVNSIRIFWIMRTLIRSHRSWSNPKIPIQCRRNRVFSQRAIH